MSDTTAHTSERRLRTHRWVLPALVAAMVATSTLASVVVGGGSAEERPSELSETAIGCPLVLQQGSLPDDQSAHGIDLVAILSEGEIEPDTESADHHPIPSWQLPAPRQPIRHPARRDLPPAARRGAGSRFVRGPPLG